jgi:hypothetical protein
VDLPEVEGSHEKHSKETVVIKMFLGEEGEWEITLRTNRG